MLTASLPQLFILRVMINRSLSLLWFGELVSTAGSALTTMAASLLIYRLTGSTLQVSLMLISMALPSLLVGLFAGVMVDRINRKKVMLAADIIRAGLSILLPTLAAHNQLWVYGIVLLSNTVGQFFNPAQESILPEIASEKDLAAANGLMAIGGFASTAIGFALCGWMTAHFPLQWAFYTDALTFLVSAFCIFRISIPKIETGEHTHLGMVLENLQSGKKRIGRNAKLKSLMWVTIPAFLAFGLWNSLLLPFTISRLHATAQVYGVQEGLTALGFVAGSLVVMKLSGRLQQRYWIAISFIGMGISGGFYAFSTWIPQAVCLVVATGLLNAPFSVARRLVIQHNTPREMRGRINSVFFVIRDVAYVTGMAAAGLANSFGIRGLIMVCAVLWVLAGAQAAWNTALYRQTLTSFSHFMRKNKLAGRVKLAASQDG